MVDCKVQRCLLVLVFYVGARTMLQEYLDNFRLLGFHCVMDERQPVLEMVTVKG